MALQLHTFSTLFLCLTEASTNGAQAHKVFGVLQWLGWIVAGFTLVAAAYAFGAGHTFAPRQLIRPGLLIGIAALVATKARQWRQQMVFVDYVHAEH